MPGNPSIFAKTPFTSLMDARVKPGHDDPGCLAKRAEKRQHSRLFKTKTPLQKDPA
jgi:hypothetical protein